MYDDLLNELSRFYDECCKESDMDYLYGYFDAVAIVREMAEKATYSAATR